MFAQQVGSCSVQFARRKKQSHAKHVDIRKTLPRRQAATMFFSPSRPTDGVLAVRHSSTQSDNNKLSAAGARNAAVKQRCLTVFGS